MAVEDTVGSEDSYLIEEEELANAAQLIKKAFGILQRDRVDLLKIDAYQRGDQPGPYKPVGSTAEYKLLIKRAQLNIFPLVLAAPAQCLFLEGYRQDSDDTIGDALSAKSKSKNTLWRHWQYNRLDSKQAAIYRAALQSGASYGLVEKPIDGATSPRFRGLSPLRTTALWLDPANDDRPAFVITIDTLPANQKLGAGRAWDDTSAYTFSLDSEGTVSGVSSLAHGFASGCPVIPFTVFRDLEGRNTGIVEQLMPVQDRINQTIFDLLIAQTYGSFKVRYIAGLTPPPQRKAMQVTVGEVREHLDDDDPLKLAPSDQIYGTRMSIVLDDDGNPIPAAITADATRIMIAEDANTHFGTLDETPLDGYISSIAMSIHHVAAVSQVPPHALLGNMSNFSADALAVAESGLFRLVQELQHSFGESWEQVFALFAEAMGTDPGDSLIDAEVLWRDLSSRSFAAVADGLSKIADSLQVPKKGLWTRIPGVTEAELKLWSELEQDAIASGQVDPRTGLANAIQSSAQANSKPYTDPGGGGFNPQTPLAPGELPDLTR